MIRARLLELNAALGLLTRLPVGRLPMPDDAAGHARAAWAWPLAGALAGAAGGAVQLLLLAAGLSPLAAAPWALATMLLLTGALHEDGLSDTADGFGGGRGRERKLQIMRDSRIGSYGAAALALSLLARGTALAEIAMPFSALVVAAAVARAAMLLPLLLLLPARADGLSAGLGRPGTGVAVLGVALAGGLALLLLPVGAAWLAALAAGLSAAALTLLAWRQIGGQTGDVLGATAVMAECAALATLAATL